MPEENKSNLFQSIGKGVGGLLEGAGRVAGGAVKGAADIFGAIPAIRRSTAASKASEAQTQLREQEIINNAARMLAQTPPEKQQDILAALKRIGLSDEAIGAAQQVAQSGKPLGLEEFRKIAGGEDLTQQFELGPRGKVAGATFQTPKTAKEISPSTQIKQKQLDRLNLLEDKIETGTATPEEADELKSSLQINRPLVEFGKLPGSAQYLTEEERKEQAKQPLNKPLSNVETKGVSTTIKSILGDRKTLPFGLKPGAAVSQSNMESLWEQTIEETGYAGRGRVAKKQIESRFDREVTALNKGKGLGVLANQYEWDRKKWEAKQKPIDKKRFQEKADKGLTGMQILQKAFNSGIITATEFKNLQVNLRNKTVTMEDILKKLDEIVREKK